MVSKTVAYGLVTLFAVGGCGPRSALVEAPAAVDQAVEPVARPVVPGDAGAQVPEVASGPSAAWLGVLGADPTVVPLDVAVTPDGGLVVVGQFFDRIDVDPGAVEDFRVSQGQFDAFVVSIDSQGRRRWARTWGGVGDDKASDLAVAADGSIHVAGEFEDRVSFDSGAGLMERTSNGDFDTYLLKLDATGSIEWVQAYGGVGDNRVGGVAVASDGSIFFTGYFYDGVDLDQGTGVDERRSAGGRDVFVLRLGPTGQRLWARTYGGAGEDFAFEIAASSDGSSFIGGKFSGRIDFDPGPGVQERTAVEAEDDAYVLALGPAGDFAWVRMFGGVGHQEISALEEHDDGGVVVAGLFDGTLDLDSSRHGDEQFSRGGNDSFVVHLGRDGGVLRTTVFSGNEDNVVVDLALARDSSLLAVGWFEDKLDLDPGRGVFEPRARGRSDGFAVLLGPDHAFRWGWGLGGTDDDAAMAAAALGDDTFAIAGYFSDGIDLDPGPEDATREAIGHDDAFIVAITGL
jgi:hypothetical protein